MVEKRYINSKIRPSSQEMMDRLLTITDRIEKEVNDMVYPNATKFLEGLNRIAKYGEE